MGQKEKNILEAARANPRCRVLAEEHFEFRGGASPLPVVPREARLRPEYAGSYPCLTPDVWEIAAVVTEKVTAWQGYRSRRGMR